MRLQVPPAMTRLTLKTMLGVSTLRTIAAAMTIVILTRVKTPMRRAPNRKLQVTGIVRIWMRFCGSRR